MTRTTIHLDTELMFRLKQLAGTEGKSVAAIVREAITAYLVRQQPPRKLSIIGIGHSGKGNLSEDVEQLLKEKFRKRRSS